MMPRPVARVVILGGGTSGWMCAAVLARTLAQADVSITLVESDQIGTIGVGEATIPTIKSFNSLLGIDEVDFIKRTQGTFKLGIEFVDWGKLGDRYIHPFGTYGLDRPEVKFRQMWLKLRGLSQDVGDIGDYNLTLAAARLNRFGLVSAQGGLLSTLRHAYHIDASLYARYLRDYAIARGVRRVEGVVASVGQRADGFISALVLKDGGAITGDLFVDCSGFRGFLIEETLKAGYEDWTHWLPCDRAVAMPCENAGPLLPYTRASADQAGWRWRIPLQHRIGNGYVYSSQYLDDATAAARLTATLEGDPLDGPRFLKFKAGHRKRLWDKNVVAIGLAAGFIEPLESTSIHLVQTGVSRLIQLFPDMNFNPVLIEEFNRLSIREYEQVRDFIILHYKLTERDDTPFWQHCKDMDIPTSLARKLSLFRDKGRMSGSLDELFSENSWLAVMLGQGGLPDGYDPVVDSIPVADTRRALLDLKAAVFQAAKSLPEHSAFIRSHCQAELAKGHPRLNQVGMSALGLNETIHS